MKCFFTAIIIVLIASAQVGASNLSILSPSQTELTEGRHYKIEWQSAGIASVDISAFGTRTPVGGDSRGDFTIPIAKRMPADNAAFEWIVPWIDSVNFAIEIIGYDEDGELLGSATKVYSFRPAVLAGKYADGIYLDLHHTENQRLYVQKSGRITVAYLCTSSRAYDWRSPQNHPNAPHDHAGVFRILDKTPMHYSRLFQVDMPWAMRYNGGHYIHATSPDQYQFLGTPASSGCNRLTYQDARQLYSSTPVGTRVEIIGP